MRGVRRPLASQSKGGCRLLTDLLIIFCLQALYVAVTTVRWIILVRGQRLLAGLGVTMWGAQGREGERLVLMAVTRRKFAPKLMDLLAELDPQAFVVRTEPQAFRGGFLLKYLKFGNTF